MNGSNGLAPSLPRPHLCAMANSFRTTLWRVLLIQLITLALLWLFQSRYAYTG